VPRTVVPSMKVTLPVTVVVGEVTEAVNLTDCPAFDGFTDEIRVVVVLA